MDCEVHDVRPDWFRSQRTRGRRVVLTLPT
jgi:hypothetical protein